MQSSIARFRSSTLTAATLTTTLFFVAHFALAQPTEVDDGTLSKFVNAYTQVQEINSEYEKRLLNVADADKLAELQEQAQEKMYNAVTRNNISMEDYQRIAQQISTDASLRSRVQEQLQSGSGR